MRTNSATILAAQKSATATPYIYLYFTDGSTSYTYTTTDSPNRVKSVKHTEEPYNGYAVIVLSNVAKDLPDLRGFMCQIGYGYSADYTGGVVEPLWVKRQFFSSRPGSLDCLLYLEDAWAVLREMEDIGSLLGGSPPYYEVDYSGTSFKIYDIIKDTVEAAGFDIEDLGVHDDGIINALEPLFVVNSAPFEPAQSVIYRLLNMTKCFMRIKSQQPDYVDSTVATVVAYGSGVVKGNSCGSYGGRIWVFLWGSFTSSPDGLTWDSPTVLANGASAFVDTDNGYVHRVRSSGGIMYYQRGLLNSDGTITWDTEVEITGTSGWCGPYRICVDSNQHPIVAYAVAGVADCNVIKSDASDGTWDCAAGFPVVLRSGYPGNIGMSVTPLNTQAGFYVAYKNKSGNNSWFGKLYTDAGGWGSEETIVSYPGAYNTSGNVIADASDIIYFDFIYTTPLYLYYRTALGMWTFISAPLNTNGNQTWCPMTLCAGAIYAYSHDSTTIKQAVVSTSTKTVISTKDITTKSGMGSLTMIASPLITSQLMVFYDFNLSGGTVSIGASIFSSGIVTNFQLIYPQSWTDYHQTYTSDKPSSAEYQFKEFEWRDHVRLPHVVNVICNKVAKDDGTWDVDQIITGEYSRTPEAGYNVIKQYEIAEEIDNQTDADNRASAIAIRQHMETELGYIQVQHDCGLELYDWVKIRDKRNVANYTDYPTAAWGKDCVVGTLVHTFIADQGVYTLDITLNGITSAIPSTGLVKKAAPAPVGGTEPTPVTPGTPISTPTQTFPKPSSAPPVAMYTDLNRGDKEWGKYFCVWVTAAYTYAQVMDYYNRQYKFANDADAKAWAEAHQLWWAWVNYYLRRKAWNDAIPADQRQYWKGSWSG